jgi:hypothetical protein
MLKTKNAKIPVIYSLGVVVVNSEGIMVKSTLESSLSAQVQKIVGLISFIISKLN